MFKGFAGKPPVVLMRQMQAMEINQLWGANCIKLAQAHALFHLNFFEVVILQKRVLEIREVQVVSICILSRQNLIIVPHQCRQFEATSKIAEVLVEA